MMKVHQIEVCKLVGIGCNNPKRVTSSSLSALKESIATYGIMVPVLAEEKSMTIIDGHRRVQCAKELGMAIVPVILCPNGISGTALYAELNMASRKFSGADKLYAAATAGVEFPGGSGTSIKRMITIMGAARSAQLSQSGHSSTLYQKSIRIARYCGLVDIKSGTNGIPLAEDELASIKAVIEWIIACKSSRMAEEAIKGDVSPTILLDAINSNRKLEMRWS